jgi:DHA1 family inner membrane transport protein
MGTFIGGWLDWRATMWFVAIIGTIAGLGLAWRLPQIPMPPSVSLARRLQPLADARVLLTLLTTWLAYGGLFLVYTYIGLSFAGATGGDARVLAILLLVWGVAATIGNLVAGRLTDRFGSRRIINGAIALVAIDFALLPWTAGTLSTAVPALVVWGLCGWGLLVPQQHRLIGIDPASAPLLLGLNSAALYVGVSMAGLIGGAALAHIDARSLGLVGSIFILASLAAAEGAQRLIARPARRQTVDNAVAP